MKREPVRVLIADDDPASRRVLKLLLNDATDIAVTTEAASGREAVELIQRLRPHVALIACGLPDLDCLEVVRLVQAQTPKVRTIVLETYLGRCKEAQQAGADSYLPKEASREQLLAAIRGNRNGS